MATPGPTPTTQRTRGNPQRSNPLPQNIVKDVVPLSTIVSEVPEVKEEDLSLWLENLYGTINISDDEIKALKETFSYRGFNRHDVLKQLKVVFPDHKLAMQAIILIALRGPQQGSVTKLTNGKTLRDYGIPGSGGQGTKTLTCNKIQAATADLAAYFLKKMDVPKRVNVPLPGWLQFPSAGGIKLPESYREQHIEFSKKFSALIGGNFQEQIYMQMQANAYLDPRLRLFDG